MVNLTQFIVIHYYLLTQVFHETQNTAINVFTPKKAFAERLYIHPQG